MPTHAGIATVGTAVVGLAAGRIFGIFELYIVAAAMLALVACAVGWVLLNWRSLDVRRTLQPARLHAGRTSTVTLHLSNRRFLPTPVARITDEVQGAVRADAQVPPIRRNTSTRASYRVPTKRRGLVAIGPMRTLVTDPFGLASTSRTSAPDVDLLVLPHVDEIAPPPQPGGVTAEQVDRSPSRVGAHGDEFSSLRPYALGDDLRKVHWPSTARSDELVVRNEQIPEHGYSLVLLDIRTAAADSDTFELMVSAAASIVVACHERGDRIRLVTTGGDDLIADSDAGYDAMLDMLALVRQSVSPNISMPLRLGRAGAEVGVMVVADDAENLIAILPTGVGGLAGTLIVRFRTEEAKSSRPTPRLASSRMIEIQPGDTFAAAWSRAVGLTPAVRR